MSSQRKVTDHKVYQLKISLKGIKPPIWRRIQVISTITLQELHRIIQETMGWDDYHLHEFWIDGIQYGQAEGNSSFSLRDENKFHLAQVAKREKFKFRYIYDFGDSWDHEIVVEKILSPEPEVIYPVCLKGKRACPPEDCGGIWGYGDFLEAIQDSSHQEHEDLLEWVGDDFDPEAFDIDEINKRLRSKCLYYN